MKQKEPKHKLYGVAETLFVEQGLSGTAIAEQLGISANTLSKWRESMEWDAKRDSYLSTPRKIRELLLQEMKNITEGKDTKIDADALSKVSKALQAMENRISIPVIISVFKEFDMWMVDMEPQLAVRFTEFHKMFIAYRAQQETR